MEKTTASGEDQLRKIFRSFNKFMVFLWKLGLADWINLFPTVSGQILVLTHTGRKTGNKHQTPVNYALIDGDLYVTAGFGAVADWYKNIQKQPEVEIWLTEGRWNGTAEDVSGDANRIQLLREVLIGSGFAAPMFGLHPKKMDDDTLDELTKEYKLIRIQRTAERTGRDGPGELAWIWPLIAVLLLLWKCPKRKKIREHHVKITNAGRTQCTYIKH